MCLDFELISAYLDNELFDEEKSLVERHLNECEKCNNRFKNLQIITGTIRSLKDPEFSANFALKVMKKLEDICPSFEALSYYAENGSDKEISKHLAHCDKCNIVLNNIKTIIKVTGELPDYKYSGDFVSKVLNKLDTQCLTDEQISAYADGEVNLNEEELFNGHIAECSECSSRLVNLNTLIKSVNSLDTSVKYEVSDDFMAGIFNKIEDLEPCVTSEQLTSYLDNMIDLEEEKLKIETHLEKCSECATQFKNLETIRKAVSKLETPQIGDDFVARVMERLPQAQKEGKLIEFWGKLKFKPAMVAGLTALLGVVVTLSIAPEIGTPPDPDSTQPPVTKVVQEYSQDVLFGDQDYGTFDLGGNIDDSSNYYYDDDILMLSDDYSVGNSS